MIHRIAGIYTVPRLWIVCAFLFGGASASAVNTPDSKTVPSASRQNGACPLPKHPENKKNPPHKVTVQHKTWEFDKSASGWFPVEFTGSVATELGVITKRLRLKDILEGTRGGVLLHFTARRGCLGVSADLCYGNIQDTGHTSYSPYYGAYSLPLLDSIQCSITDLQAFWRVGNEKASFDVLAGFRLLQVRSHFAMDVGYIDCDKDFYDPLIGGMLRFCLSDVWSISARARFSGFGIGSELTSDLETHLSCRISEHMEFFIGYRFIDFEYRQEAAGFFVPGVWHYPLPQMLYEQFNIQVDCTIHGPTAGFSLRW